MSTREALLAEIEAFLIRHDMAVSTFGRLALKDHKLVKRLREGKDITLGSADAVRDFMRDYQDRKRHRDMASVSAN